MTATRYLKNGAIAFLYALTFILIYKLYLNPTFEYAHYYLLERTYLSMTLSIVNAVVPVLFYRGMRALSSFIAILIYALCFVPTIFILLFSLDRGFSEILLIQLALVLGMMMFFLSDRILLGNISLKIPKKLPIQFLHFIALVFTGLVIRTYTGNMRLVSFAEVYDLRLANNEIPMNHLIGYIVMWLTYCLYPLYFVIGIFKKKWAYICVAVLGSLLIYMSTGAKAGLLTPVILVGVFVMLRFKGDFFLNFLLALIVISLCLLFLIPDESAISLWGRSLLFARTMGVGGWSTYTYYEFFTANQLTYFSHIGIINAITDQYPYGPLSLGQVIGVEYSGSELANFNANFWASDGIASLGIWGIYIMNMVVGTFLILVNYITRKFDLKFVCLCFTTFILAMLNIPFLTALVSGGGLLTIAILLFIEVKAPLRTSDLCS